MNTPTTPVNSIHASVGLKSESHHQHTPSSVSAAVMCNSHTAKINAANAAVASAAISESQAQCAEACDMDDLVYQSQPPPQANTGPSLALPHPLLRQGTRPDPQQPGTELDYESTVRASYYGRRMYPTFDPANAHACPLRFVRQFEHAAQHNGLKMKAWARRFNSCLFGRAEDWAFEESPLELAGASWDTRKRQFLDWALLPAEQELRRQRLLRFFQTEAELSIDFVYSFEETARGLRDYKEDVWVRKCIANLQPPLRGALFELWPDGLPVRFRELRDSLYAVDWSLYEAASAPLKVVKYGMPYIYEAYSQQAPVSSMSSLRQLPASRTSMCSSTDRQPTGRPSLTLPLSNGNAQGSVYSPPAPPPSGPARKKQSALNASVAFHSRNSAGTNSTGAPGGAFSSTESSDGPSSKVSSETSRASGPNMGAYELISTLSRIPERERLIITAALERLAMGDDAVFGGEDGAVPVTPTRANGSHTSTIPISPTFSRQRSRFATISSPATRPISLRPGNRSRAAAAAAAAAATAHIACMDNSLQQRFPGGSLDEGTRSSSGDHGAARSSTSSGQSTQEHEMAELADDPGGGGGQRGRARGSSRVSGDMAASGIVPQTECEQPAAPAPAGEQHQQSQIKLRLRTRPLTSMACCSRPQSSPAIDGGEIRESGSSKRLKAIESVDSIAGRMSYQAATDGEPTVTRKMHARKLSSRKSDSALTTATRSMRAGEQHPALCRDSADNALRSPEFTVVHPAIDLRPPHARRGRFAFIRKLSHILHPH
ncbi:hypothetical protein BX070DRAFT_231915 [Coemansia spiralis]|nr:hypothetical protein BX070DRAFT_231915 [Coemansia spiralis]